MTARWWTVLLISGAGTIGLHVHLAQAASPGIDSILLHFGILFFVFLCALPAGRVLGRTHARLVLLWTFLVAAVSLGAYLSSDLLLSAEVNRYRWDGEVAEAGYNPYEVSPTSPDLQALRESFGDEIPHADRKGLYPPLAELLFYLMARMDMNTLLHYRVLFSVMALLGGLAFLPLARGANVPVTRVLVFLWHPLLIIETAANAHIEAMAIFFVLSSLSLLINRHHLTPMASLAMAVLVKMYPLALLPLFIRRVPLYRVILFFLLLAGAFLPFIGAGRSLVNGIFDYLNHAQFNPGLYLGFDMLFETLGKPEWTRVAVGVLGVGVAIALYLTDDGTNASILRRGFYLTLPPILLGPVLNPWYLLWLIPFLALVGPRNPLRMAFLYLSGSVFLVYLQQEWGVIPWWVTVLELVPVPLLGAWGLWKTRKTRGQDEPTPMSAAPMG